MALQGLGFLIEDFKRFLAITFADIFVRYEFKTYETFTFCYVGSFWFDWLFETFSTQDPK